MATPSNPNHDNNPMPHDGTKAKYPAKRDVRNDADVIRLSAEITLYKTLVVEADEAATEAEAKAGLVRAEHHRVLTESNALVNKLAAQIKAIKGGAA